MQGQKHCKLRTLVQHGIIVPGVATVYGEEIYRVGAGVLIYVESVTIAADGAAASVWLGDGSANAWDAITDANAAAASVPNGGNYVSQGTFGLLVPSGSLWLAANNASGIRVMARVQLGLYVPVNFEVEPGEDLAAFFGIGRPYADVELAHMEP